MTRKNKRIAVIGGGIIGTAAAFYLSNEDVDVTLYDEGTGQATSAAAGIISPWLSRRRNKKWYRLVKTGAAFYPDFMKDIGSDPETSSIYNQTGTLLFKKKPEHLQEMLEIGLKRREDAPEIGELKIVSPEEIRQLIPIYEGNKSAVFVSGGARVDGAKLVEHLLEKLEEKDVLIQRSKASIQPTADGRYKVIDEKGEKEFDAVILAAGAWIPSLLEPLGYEVDVRAQKGQLAELTLPIKDTNHWPVIMPAGEKDIIPFADGQVIIGATHEDDKGYDLTIEKEVLRPMIEEATEGFSSIFREAEQITYRSGTRAYTSDYSPFFGEVPGSPNLYTASGMGATGLTAGPVVGKILADLAMDRPSLLPLEDYPIDQYIRQNIR